MAEIWLSLTPRERKLIRERCEVPADIRQLLNADASGAQTIVLTPAQIDVLREAVADQLQRAGFDENWDANPEGRALEGIIDKLQPPKS